MSEQIYPSAPVMLRIDGARARAIREAKGLTQLYVATVVEVTTDTVSRWENKRYPTIKKDNALRLAAALEVELDEILEKTDGVPGPNAADGMAAGRLAPPDPMPDPAATAPPAAGRWPRPGHLTVLLATLVFAAAVYYLIATLAFPPAAPALSVTRIVAPHFVPGQPLPVFLKVDHDGGETVSVILRETLPPEARLSGASPAVSDTDGGTIKWLARVSGTTMFIYTLTTEPEFSGSLRFAGTVRDARSTAEVETGGAAVAGAGTHHWADRDGDNRISDEEILAVYDLRAGDSPAIVDLDLVEEMWLGEGYRWDPDRRQFAIIP